MKKDKRFLKELEDNLINVNKKHREEIISKYQNIISEEKAKRRKIVDIVKGLGDPKEVALKEMESYKKDKFFVGISNKIKGLFKKKDSKKKNKKKNKKTDFVKEEKKRIDKELKEEKKRERKEKREKKKQERKENKTSLKERLNKLKGLITKDISFKKKDREEEKKEKEKQKEHEELIEIINEPVADFGEEISDSAEVVSDKEIFESKKDRNRRILLKTLGIILTILLLFIWLWISVIFIASVFAYLDGIRFIGVNIALFGLDALFLWIVIMVNRAIFKKKSNF